MLLLVKLLLSDLVKIRSVHKILSTQDWLFWGKGKNIFLFLLQIVPELQTAFECHFEASA